jgi:hypothetical protein
VASSQSVAASERTSTTAAVILSPLLNLAFATGTGPTLNQARPLFPFGNSSISGTAMLSLLPDRRNIDVRLHLNSAAPVSIRLRRLTGDHLESMRQPAHDDLLVIEIIALQLKVVRPSAIRLSLSNRSACLPLRASELLKEGICLLGLQAPSIQGVHVDPAPTQFGNRGRSNCSAERMLMEIEAAENSKSAVAASRHVELANLYAGKLKKDGLRLA